MLCCFQLFLKLNFNDQKGDIIYDCGKCLLCQTNSFKICLMRFSVYPAYPMNKQKMQYALRAEMMLDNVTRRWIIERSLYIFISDICGLYLNGSALLSRT